ncbi:unnamed protein product, partial [Ascophyllum nodosum]
REILSRSSFNVWDTTDEVSGFTPRLWLHERYLRHCILFRNSRSQITYIERVKTPCFTGGAYQNKRRVVPDTAKTTSKYKYELVETAKQPRKVFPGLWSMPMA